MSLRDFVQAAMAAGTKASVDVLTPLRSVPLLDLVKEMQPELTSPLPKVSPTALFVLSAAAIHRVEPHLPSAQEVDVVVDFLVSKVGHFTTIDSAVEGLSRLVCWGLINMPEAYIRGEVVTKVVGKVLARIQVQSMFGRSKIAAMDLVEAITNPNVIEMVAETCGRDFLSVFLTCVDGEREPELVLKMIQMTGRLVTAFPASHLNFFIEDFFVTISSYFPVLFNPPPHCPVTRQMLKDALHPLMLFPVFHEHCIPFLFAKLTSPAASAKHDSLALLRTLFTPPSEGNAPYPPSLLQPHISDTLALLRGEVVKMVQLTSVMGGDNAVQAVLRSTLDVVTRIGEVLGEGYAADDILSMADHSLLSPVMSLVESGSDSRAYAVLLHALTKKSPTVCGNVCAYLMPMLGWKLAELQEKVLVLSPLEVRKVSSSVTIVGALLSSVEMLKNGTSTSSTGGVVTSLRGLKPESVEDIVPIVCSILNGDCPSSALHLTPLCADVIATYIAIIDLLEAGKGSAETEEASTTEATKEKLVRMLATRVFTYEREAGDDEVPTSIAKAIGNVSRVEGSVVTRSLLLASYGTDNNDTATSFIMTHKHEISMPILFDALLSLNRPEIDAIICGLILFGVPGAIGLTSSTPVSTRGASEGVLPAAADTHGSGSVVVSKYVAMCLDRIGTVVKRSSDDSKIVWLVELLQASPSILAALDGCTEGPDLVTLILDILVALGSPAALSVFDSIINASALDNNTNDSSTLLWACAVAVAPISIFTTAPATTTDGWFARALALLPTATNNDPQTQVRELCALRAMASIANKSAEFAYAATAGVDIRVVAAVAKGRLARGAKEGVLACCESLLSWLYAPDASRTLVDATSAFGGLLANPQPSVSSPFWKQRTYCTLLESLLQYPAPSAAHATRSLYAIHALVASAGSSVVDPTAISNLVAIVHLGQEMSATEADVHVANECRAATGLCLIQFMSLADKGLCADALRRTADLFLRNTTIAACARSAVAPPPRARSAAGIAPRVTVPLPLSVRLQAIEVHRSLYGYILGLDDDGEEEEVSSAPATKARRAEDSPASGVGKHLSASKGGGIQASPETLRAHMIAQKANVMEWLSKCQDDRKRLVRAAAGLARHEWYQLKGE